MEADHAKDGYNIWAVDDVVYGPVDLSTVIGWIGEERVRSDTWIFVQRTESWHKAVQVPELQTRFQANPEEVHRVATSLTVKTPLIPGLKPGMLRRVKILGEMTDQQLGRFAQFMEVQQVRQWTEIVKQGIPADSMYLVLDGEVRVRLMIDRMETTIAILSAGECFGEIALFDYGPRSADVVANTDCVLLRISVHAFKNLIQEAPELATPFLLAICKTVSVRLRAGNKRMRDSISLARAANASW